MSFGDLSICPFYIGSCALDRNSVNILTTCDYNEPDGILQVDSVNSHFYLKTNNMVKFPANDPNDPDDFYSLRLVVNTFVTFKSDFSIQFKLLDPCPGSGLQVIASNPIENQIYYLLEPQLVFEWTTNEVFLKFGTQVDCGLIFSSLLTKSDLSPPDPSLFDA